jgi:glycosyltransferase involved in cell wall biosynthesis|tara:strand:+ start:14077 stop:15048 length:972 start_codon:yes stop_codon:yes gene_type:complete
MRARRVTELARSLGTDVVIERYYNFGGEGVRAASATGALMVLEVNAPVIDYPGSPKSWIDRAMLVEPMRRWREWQCRRAHLFVTPSAGILPTWVEAEQVLRLEWGADTARFTPDARGEVPFRREPGDTVVVFAGAFRPWHGAVHLVRAIADLRLRGREDIKAVFIGDGPELPRVRRAAAGLEGIVFTGALSHDRMPACLAAADILVLPNVPVSASAGHTSPLKLFEYLAVGKPIVASDLPAIREVLRDGQNAVLVEPGRPDALAAGIRRVLEDRTLAERIARGAFDEAPDYSWDRRAERIEQLFERVLGGQSQPTPQRSTSTR